MNGVSWNERYGEMTDIEKSLVKKFWSMQEQLNEKDLELIKLKADNELLAKQWDDVYDELLIYKAQEKK